MLALWTNAYSQQEQVMDSDPISVKQAHYLCKINSNSVCIHIAQTLTHQHTNTLASAADEAWYWPKPRVVHIT